VNPTLLPIAGIGFVIGFRHAFEPDHLAAVTTLATRQGTARDAARLGAAWGVGHTVAVGGVAGVLVLLGWRLPEPLHAAAELLVAALLIVLGGAVLLRHRYRHAHSLGEAHSVAHALGLPHHHAPPLRDARRSLGFGIAHGIAGSGALAVLLVAAAPTRVAQFTYFAAFGTGTIVGMLSVSALVARAVRLAGARQGHWASMLHLGAAAASIVAGIMLAVVTTLNLL
jgi:high-affinity nickel-transport protein